MNNNYRFQQMVFQDIAFSKDKAWFCHIYYNALFSLDLDTYEISLETFLPKGRSDFNQYSFMEYYNGKLIISPRNAENILIYDIDTKEITTVGIDLHIDGLHGVFNLFSKVKIYNNNAYIFPGRYPAIIKLNLDTLELTYLTEWYDEIKEYVIDSGKVLFPYINCYDDKCVYLPFWQGNIIVQFYMETGTHQIHIVGNEKTPFSGIQYNGQEFWISLRDKKALLKWNKIDNTVIQYSKLPDNIMMENGFAYIERFENNIFAIPLYGDHIVCLDTTTGEFTKIKKLLTNIVEEIEMFGFTQNNMLCYRRDNKNNLWLYSVFEGEIKIMDLNFGMFKSYRSIITDKKDIERIRNRELEN